MKAPQPKEDALQKSVCQLLDIYERQGKLTYFAVPNGGSRHRLEAAKLQGQGVRAGVPDLVLLFPLARVQFWELKRPGSTGALKGSQASWARKLIHFDFAHYVIRSLSDATAALAW